ncbi:MAG: ABC transporter permease [Deltaproteobacteria bacterium]|nr:ABC transporter permease [Deltaproteobacteria bacterium]
MGNDRTENISGIFRRVTKNMFTGMGFIPLLILLLVVITALNQKNFATFSNLQNISRQFSLLALIAVAQMFPILVAGLDLSQGGVMGVVSVLSTLAMLEYGVIPGCILGILIGGMFGLVNGTLIALFNISPFVVTLGMMSFARGLALMITNGQSIYGLPDSFSYLGTEYIGPFPIPLIIAGFIFFISYVILHRTRFGRYIYATGGNQTAARISGINVKLIKACAYMYCSLLTGLASVVISSRVNSGQPNLGTGAPLEAIAAVVIGGVSLFGGEGKLKGVFLGVVVLSLISNSLNILNVNSYLQMMIMAMVIILAVIVDRFRYAKD